MPTTFTHSVSHPNRRFGAAVPAAALLLAIPWCPGIPHSSQAQEPAAEPAPAQAKPPAPAPAEVTAPATPAPADAPPTPPSTPPAPPAPVEPATPAPAPAPAPVPDTSKLPVERNVYLPYEDLEAIFEKDGRGVFLPYREFLDLWSRIQASEQEEPEEEAPVDGVIRSATYRAEVSGAENARSVIVRAEIEVESFRKGWATIPLSSQVLSIGEAETGEASLHLGDGGYEVILPAKGVYKLNLTLFAPIQRKDGEMTAKLVLPRSPVSRFEGVIPGRDWSFELSDSIPYTVTSQGDATGLAFSFGQREQVEIRWRKASEDSQMTPLLFGETEVASHVIPGAVQTTVDLRYRILRAGVDTFELSVPSTHEVLSIEGKNLKDWRIFGQGPVQRLSVKLHTVVRDFYDLRVVLEKSLVGLPSEVEVPTVVAANVARQSGTVNLTAAKELDVQVTAAEGLSQQAYEGGDESTLVGRYRFLEAPYKLDVKIAKATPDILATSRTSVEVRPEMVRLGAEFDYRISRVPVFETRLGLPAGYTDWQVNGDEVEDFAVEDGGESLRIRFREHQGESAAFRLEAKMRRPDAAEPFVTPVFTIDGARSHEGQLGLRVDSSLDPSTEELGGLRTAALEPGLGPLGMAFSYRDAAKPGTIAFEEKQPQVTGFVQQLVELRDEGVRYQWWIDYEILYAGLDRLLLKIPAEIAKGLRIEGEGVKEIDRNAPIPDGEDEKEKDVVYWAVQFPERIQGDYQLGLSYEATAANGARAVEVPMIQLPGVFREAGQVAVHTAPNVELGQVDSGLEVLDPRELAGPLRARSLSAAYRYQAEPGTLELTVSRNRFLDVPKALVTYADISGVVSGDGAITTEVIYWVRNASQSNLQIQLPAGSKMTSDVFVGDGAQQPMSNAQGNEILIQLPAAASAGKERDVPVRFVYELPSREAGKSLPRRGDLVVPEPEVLNAGVLQTRLNLFLPPGYRYLNFGGPYELRGKAKGWRDARRSLDFLIPALGPPTLDGVEVPWAEPPAFTGNLHSGFNAPVIKEGQSFVLHRLGRPAPVVVAFLSQGLSTAVEAVLCLLVLAIGLSLTGSQLESKFLFLIFAGLLPLALAGMVAPHLADVYRAAFLGAVASAGAWILAGFWWLIRPRPEDTALHEAPPGPGLPEDEGPLEWVETEADLEGDGAEPPAPPEEFTEDDAIDETEEEAEDEADADAVEGETEEEKRERRKKFSKSRRSKRKPPSSSPPTGKNA